MGKKEPTGFVNPFEPGVTYEMFIEALGDTPVSEYLQGFDEHQIEWIENEITNYKNK